LEATGALRALFSISDEDHARIAGDITRDQTRFVDSAKKLLDGLRVLEVCRFSLVFDARPEALLARHALLLRESS
jgi:hypothetical protein